MDAHYNQSVKSATLYFNLEDVEQEKDLQLALASPKITYAIRQYFEALRQIRKYNSLSDAYPVTLDAKEMRAVEASEEYYRMLFVRILEQAEVANLID